LLSTRAVHQEALTVKANEAYPKNQISSIQSILANLDELEKDYNDAITKADNLFNSYQYNEALLLYQEAQNLKPQEEYAPQQILKIKQILADRKEIENKYNRYIRSADSAFHIEEYKFARKVYVQAKDVLPLANYPTLQINKIDALLANLSELEKNYEAAIAKADASFNANQYANAKEDYTLALTFKSNETYPKQRIEEINALLSQLNALDAAYQRAIQEGDRNFNSKHYSLSLTNYKDALKIKENEAYPKNQIAAIESILAELNKLEINYNQAIGKADGHYNDKQYSEALVFYKEAQSLKPNEKYPPNQINRIKSLLDQQSSMEEDYVKAIAAADKLFNEKQYQSAISSYQGAIQLKPSENYPKDQITKIREILAAREEYYNAFIKQGDDAYRKAIFQDAIVAYENALGVFPEEAYPRMMLDKIDAKIRRESVVSLVTSPETITAGQEKSYSFTPIDYRDRQDNYILIEMKNVSEERIRVFINFGKESIKNGGYSVNLVQRDGFTKYFIQIDQQLRWKNEDNNWISLLPVGGDLEVKMIRISREEKSN